MCERMLRTGAIPDCKCLDLDVMHVFNTCDTCTQVAIALSLLTAEVTKPPFNKIICTFSAVPELHLVKGETLVEKVGPSSNLGTLMLCFCWSLMLL